MLKHMSRSEESYNYPSNYENFPNEQKAVHFRGVNEGQQLFQKYVPAEAVDVLKTYNCWDIQYSFDHPSGMQLMEGALPEHYNKLHKTNANVKDSLNDPDHDMESVLEENGDEESESVEEQEMDDDVQQKQMEEKDVGEVEEERDKIGEK